MNQATLDRRDVLAKLFPNPQDYLMVAGLAGTARDAAELTGDADYLFTLGGFMGGAVPMGLGMALASPRSQVAVITGDGELLMAVGALATVASMAPDNLSIVCIDNGCHGETGGQTGHTARRTDLAIMAEGAGIPSVMTIGGADLEAGAKFLKESPAPRFLLVPVKMGPPADYRRNLNAAICRDRFRTAHMAAG